LTCACRKAAWRAAHSTKQPAAALAPFIAPPRCCSPRASSPACRARFCGACARDLFVPALVGAGLHPDRVIYAEAGDEQTVLLCLEEGRGMVVSPASSARCRASR
jgi:hypothetical protein